MKTKKYITVSGTIRRARLRVALPALLVMTLIMLAAIYILATQAHSLEMTLLAILLMVCSFIAFGIVMTILGDRWKTWAYKNVDDVREFRIRAFNNRFSVNIYPSRWHTSIKQERRKALQAVRDRIKNNTLEVTLEADYSVPRKLIIKRSIFYYLVPLGFCIWFFYKATGRIINSSSSEPILDITLSLLSLVGILFLFVKLIKYPCLISISDEGIWSKKTGLQPWNMVDSFGFTDKERTNTSAGSYTSTQLYIKFKPESGLTDKERVIIYDMLYLNKRAETVERVLKVYSNQRASS